MEHQALKELMERMDKMGRQALKEPMERRETKALRVPMEETDKLHLLARKRTPSSLAQVFRIIAWEMKVISILICSTKGSMAQKQIQVGQIDLSD